MLLVLIVIVPPGSGLLWLWQGWRAEQPHIAALNQRWWAGICVASQLGTEPIHRGIPACLPSRMRPLTDRVTMASIVSFRDEAIEHVSGFSHLRRLELAGGRITSAGMASLRRMESVRELDMQECAIEVDSRNRLDLRGMRSLRELHMRNMHTVMADWDVAELARLQQLEVLDLDNATTGGFPGGITDRAASDLCAMTQLRELTLSQARISDATVVRLATLPKLRVLSLNCARITDAGAEPLTRMTQLEGLSLAFTQITDASVDRLARMTWLKGLDVRYTRITREGEARLRAALPNTRINEPVKR